MEAQDIFKAFMETYGEDQAEKLTKLKEQVKADFLAELQGADDEITIKRGYFAVKVREIMAEVFSRYPSGNMLQTIELGLKSALIATKLEEEFFGKADKEVHDDETQN